MARYVLLGIGNELNGDDAIGHRIAEGFSAPGWKGVPCGTVPENFVSVVRKEKPQLIVIVDAAQMDLAPGQLRLLPKERLSSACAVAGTHGMPLSHLVAQLDEIAKVFFIGVQPKSMDAGTGMSPGVLAAEKEIAASLRDGTFVDIEKL